MSAFIRFHRFCCSINLFDFYSLIQVNMSFRILPISLCFYFIITACNSTKKSAATDASYVQLDTIHVNGRDQAKGPLYHASNTITHDILHTKLEVDFDWKACRMNGKASITGKPHFYPSRMLYLDARGMEIRNVELIGSKQISPEQITAEQIANDVAAAASDKDFSKFSYTYENDSIKINLGRAYKAQETYTVVIDYVARPNELKSPGGSNAITDDKGLYFINPGGENPFKMPQIWTQGETQASSVWFPTIDSPNERMTQEILMRVDDKYTTLSNGILISSVKQGDGTRIDHWKQDLPHAPYLAMMAVGEFRKITDEPWNGKEISYYVDPIYEAHAKAIFQETREMIDFYSRVLGVPYPWAKYAQIAVRDFVSGAMENTSATLHGDFMVYQTEREIRDFRKGTGVIAHELFHQWFGDLVTCESWSNLPLNESFATYGEYLWEEHKYGRDMADYRHWQSRQGYLNASKEVELIRFDYHNKEDMFDAFSYNKGGQILHMLRKVVGDRAFFASLKNYLESNQFRAVEIHHLRLAFEETTGRDLNWFFNQWFMDKGRPALKIRTQTNASSDTLTLTIEQTQDLKKTPIYTLPLDVDLYMKDRKDTRQILVTAQRQQFKFPLSEGNRPLLVNVDAERQLLADIDYPKTISEYFYQYEHAPLFGDRQEALKELSAKLANDSVYTFFKKVIEQETFPPLRHFAIQQLEKSESPRKEDAKSLFLRLYINEPHNLTRARLLGGMNRLFPGTAEMTGLNLSALKDSSYAVMTEALSSLGKSDPKLAMEKAILLERESGKDLLFAIANLYASHGSDGQLHFFHGALPYINGFDLIGFCAFYTKTARQCQIPESAIMAAIDLELIGKGANKYIRFSALKGIKDILSTWESKENTALAKLEAAKKQNNQDPELEKAFLNAKETRNKLAEIYNRAK
jgi:aminopeptidase N